jgi:hypothetical protein
LVCSSAINIGGINTAENKAKKAKKQIDNWEMSYVVLKYRM